MTATLIIAFFLLAAATFVIIRSKRSKPTDETVLDYLPAGARPLFSDAPSARLLNSAAHDEAEEARARHAKSLRERAAGGDREVLRDSALRSDARLQREILDTLVANVDASPDELAALARVVARDGHGLRSSERLARSLRRVYEEGGAQVRAADLLRVAALSDDARVFADALASVYEGWRKGRGPRLRADELLDLFEAEYQVLAPSARLGGSAFVLNDNLKSYRRRLSRGGDDTPDSSPSARSEDG